MVAAILVLGLLAGACGADIGVDQEPATPALAPRLDQEAMLNQAIAEVIRNNGPYAEAAVVEAWLVPPWILSANGPYTDEGSDNVPANVR